MRIILVLVRRRKAVGAAKEMVYAAPRATPKSATWRPIPKGHNHKSIFSKIGHLDHKPSPLRFRSPSVRPLRYNRRMSSNLVPTPPGRPRLRESELDMPAGPQKVTRQLRELFREAFDQLGGVEYLVDFATRNDQNARVFVQAISKLLPASAADTKQDRIILDIPWLTRDRLAYQRADAQPLDSDITDVLPKEPR